MANEVLIGHAPEVLRELPGESVYQCVTSPPYWGLRDYRAPAQVWGGEPGCRHVWGAEYNAEAIRAEKQGRCERTGRFINKAAPLITTGRADQGLTSDKEYAGPRIATSGQFCSRCGAWRGQLGLEPTPDLYVAHLVDILREVKRVLRDDGSLYLNLGDSYVSAPPGNTKPRRRSETESGVFQIPAQIHYEYRKEGHTDKTKCGLKSKDLVGIPWEVAFALRADGWYLRSDIIWAKPNPMPESVTDRPTRSHEYIFLLTKSAKYYYDNEAVRESTSNFTGRTGSATLGGAALAPEFGPAIGTNNSSSNFRGRGDFGETQITIVGAMARETNNLQITQSIRFAVIGEKAEWEFVVDLEARGISAPLAFISGTLQRLAADNLPVRATIINSPTSPSGAIRTDSMSGIPSTDTLATAKAMFQSGLLRAGIMYEGCPALVAFEFDELNSPLFIFGTLRSSHMLHSNINTPISQGRNLRSVWTFATQPYPEAHFATFPLELPMRCIRTSPVKCCAKCGAGWERVTEKIRGERNDNGRTHSLPNQRAGKVPPPEKGWECETQTLGFRPTCACYKPGEEETRPAIILDPFAGSGTTGEAAARLGRDSILIELNPNYRPLIDARLAGITAPLLPEAV